MAIDIVTLWDRAVPFLSGSLPVFSRLSLPMPFDDFVLRIYCSRRLLYWFTVQNSMAVPVRVGCMGFDPQCL